MRVSLRHTDARRLQTLHLEPPASADRLLHVLQRPRLAASLMLWDMIAHALLLASGLWVIWEALGQALAFAAVLGWGLLVGLVVLLSELILQRPILRQPESWALRLAPWAQALDVAASPLSFFLARILGPAQNFPLWTGEVSETELRNWVETDQTEGGLEEGERKMIYSIFHFRNTLVREIMVPRIDVFFLEATTPLKDAIQGLVSSGHSRVPVFEENIDNIVGILYAKDLLRVKLDEPGVEDAPIRSYLRAAYFVPESKRVDELLNEMQAKRIHMGVVVDEYGGVAGIVTLEDIVEQIVGEIRDEYDVSEELPYQKVSDDEYLFRGTIDIGEVNQLLETDLSRVVADTLGGYIYGEIGRVPAGGEEVQIGGWLLTVAQVSGRRIVRVRAQRVKAPEDIEDEDQNAVRRDEAKAH